MVSFLNSHVASSRVSLSRISEIHTGAPVLLKRAIRLLMHDPLLVIWQILTAPLWFGSGIPIPEYPSIRTTLVAPPLNAAFNDLASPAHYLDEQIRTLGRRLWLAGIFAAAFRGFTLGTIAGTVWALAGLANITSDPHVSALLVLVFVGALVGAVFGFVSRPSTMRVATMLDRTFHLDERLSTAFDPTLASITPGSMRRLQLADAANGFAEIRDEVRGAAVLPVREAVIAVLAAICLVTALLFSIVGDQIPATSNAVVPAFVPSSERFVRQQQELEAQQQAKQRAALTQSPKASENADEQGKATKDLTTVGTALKDQSITKSASDSISSGNYGEASKSLRDNAPAAQNLPQDERNALAKNLDDAASKVSPDNKDLADSTKQAASDLKAGGDQATKGLNDLADQIDKTGEKASPNQTANSSQTNSAASGSQSSSSQSTSSNPQSQAQQSQGSQQSGNSQSQQPASSNTSDPGSGMEAQPGIGSEPDQNPAGQNATQQKSGSGQSPQSQSGAGAGSQQAGQQSGNSAGQSSVPSNTGGGQTAQSPGSNAGGQPGNSSNSSSSKDASQQAGTGSGAGQTSETNQKSPGSASAGSGANSQPDGKSDTAGTGKAGNPPPGNETSGANTGKPPTAQSGNQSLVLQGTSDNNSIGTGNDIGSSSSGSGSGSGVASGSATQGQVGPAGPDSNHVPDAYRDIVKGYFDGDGTTP